MKRENWTLIPQCHAVINVAAEVKLTWSPVTLTWTLIYSTAQRKVPAGEYSRKSYYPSGSDPFCHEGPLHVAWIPEAYPDPTWHGSTLTSHWCWPVLSHIDSSWILSYVSHTVSLIRYRSVHTAQRGAPFDIAPQYHAILTSPQLVLRNSRALYFVTWPIRTCADVDMDTV